MRRWTGELKRPDLDPASRRGLQEKLGTRAERWEQGRRARLKEVNAELWGLAREHREAIRQEHRRLLGAGTLRTTVIAVGGGGRGNGNGGGFVGGPVGSGEPPAHRVISDLMAMGRPTTDVEIAVIRQQVVAAGFDPNAREKAGGRAAGIIWKDKQVKGSDMLPLLEVKYLRPVQGRLEWPPGTTIEDFERSVREVVSSRVSGVFLSRYHGEQQVGFIALSGM
jgi:hypothetical protein